MFTDLPTPARAAACLPPPLQRLPLICTVFIVLHCTAGERVEGLRFYELLEKDVVRLGQSTREYVLLHDHSGPEL